MVTRLAHNQENGGSIPSCATSFATSRPMKHFRDICFACVVDYCLMMERYASSVDLSGDLQCSKFTM